MMFSKFKSSRQSGPRAVCRLQHAASARRNIHPLVLVPARLGRLFALPGKSGMPVDGVAKL